MKVKLDISAMQNISLFENITRVSARDCFAQEGRLVFVVKQREIGKAIGKAGANIKRLEGMLKKKVKIVEYSDDVVQFVANVVAPIKIKEVVEDDGIVTITPADSMSRGLLIGRAAINLRGFEDIVKRFYPIKEIKVV